MLYSFALVSAVLGMRRQDYFQQGSLGWLRLHEKAGKRHDVPAHHRAAEALDEYLDACRLEAAGEALFQSVDRAGERLTGRDADPAGDAGHDQAPGVGAGAAPLDLLPHVQGDGDHGVSVERGDPRARAAAGAPSAARGMPGLPLYGPVTSWPRPWQTGRLVFGVGSTRSGELPQEADPRPPPPHAVA